MTWPPRRPGSRPKPQSTSRPRASWRPPPVSPGVEVCRSTTLGEAGQTLGWGNDPAGHLVTYKPPCGAPGCDADAMVWQRCGVCREVFGRCADHVSQDGREVAEAKAKHGHWQGTGIQP